MSKKSFGTPGAFGQPGTRRKASVMKFARALAAVTAKNAELTNQLEALKKNAQST